MSTLILHCSCANAFQDQHYGAGNRVHNRTTKSDKTIYRCTVCKGERPAGSPREVTRRK